MRRASDISATAMAMATVTATATATVTIDAREMRLARLATQALIDEMELTPKPGLVDRRGSGAHRDLTLASMRRSALAIEPYFAEMAAVAAVDADACDAHDMQSLRDTLAAIGRRAERAMLDATGGSNAHRGAIWTLGLLIAGASTQRIAARLDTTPAWRTQDESACDDVAEGVAVTTTHDDDAAGSRVAEASPGAGRAEASIAAFVDGDAGAAAAAAATARGDAAPHARRMMEISSVETTRRATCAWQAAVLRGSDQEVARHQWQRLDHAHRLAQRVAHVAAAIATFPDRGAGRADADGEKGVLSHGQLAERTYGATGARGEARRGFPHVIEVGLPMLRLRQREGCARDAARLDALMAIMSVLDDTCLLHRGGLAALDEAKRGARAVLDAGGTSTAEGRRRLLALDAALLRRNASPGGSADLLAAALFLDSVAPPGEHELALESTTYGHD